MYIELGQIFLSRLQDRNYEGVNGGNLTTLDPTISSPRIPNSTGSPEI